MNGVFPRMLPPAWSRALLVLLAGPLAAAGCRTSGPVPAPVPPAAAAEPPAAPRPAVAAAPAPRPAPVLLSPADLDRAMEALWGAAGVTPAPPASDAELLRRITLDVIGRIPTLDEAERFLADRAPDRRARLVDRLLDSPEHADHAADVFLDLFVGQQFRKPRLEKKLDPRAFFVDAVRENRPYDAMARQMLTFSGDILPTGPGVFLASHLKGGGPEALTSATARLFLGVQIQCAQCHDHPTDDRYKQEDFYGLVAYFVRTKTREEKIAAPPRGKEMTAEPAAEGGTPGETAAGVMAPPAAPGPAAAPAPDAAAEKNKRYLVFDKPNGKAKFKRPGADAEIVVSPRFLGREIQALPGETLRDTLARAMVSSDLFAKTAVDRLWAQLFGRGIVEPWDDLGGEGDPRHPALLTRLAEDFRRSGYDLKHLQRLLLLSRAYGLSSRATPAATPTSAPPAAAAAPVAAADPVATFARAAVRRLMPEQLFRSLLVATGAEHTERAGAEDMQKKIDRALKEILFVFGDDEMAEVDTFNGNVPQALLLFNGEITNQGARARPGGTLASILASSPDPTARLRRIFLAAYSRLPTDEEIGRLGPGLSPGPDRADGRAAYEDLFFALLTSTEMLTNH